MSDPNTCWDGERWLHWDGRAWLRWDGRAWTSTDPWASPPATRTPGQGPWPQPNAHPGPGGFIPPPAVPPPRGNTGLVVGLVVGALALLLVAGVGVVLLAAIGDSGATQVAAGRTTAPPAGAVAPTTPATEQVDLPPYDEGMDFAVESMDDYWDEAMTDDFDTEWIAPARLIPYRSANDGPTCFDEPPGTEWAFYCGNGNDDFIAWNERKFQELYVDTGPMAVWAVLAHEYGHAAQAVLGPDFSRTSESELQADCYAGAWAGWAEEGGMLYENADADARLFYIDNGAIGRNSVREQLDAYDVGRARGARGCARVYAPGFSD